MTFDEWLDDQIVRVEAIDPNDPVVTVWKLVRAQGQMLEKVFDELADQFPGTVIRLGPDSRKLMDEIDALEAALMGGGNP